MDVPFVWVDVVFCVVKFMVLFCCLLVFFPALVCFSGHL